LTKKKIVDIIFEEGNMEKQPNLLEELEYKEKKGKKDLSFEEKLAKFLKESEEKLADLKRNIENKRGGKSKR
jgi:S1 RNA binding domain protein